MNTKNLTEGRPSRLLLFFSLPLMMGNIFQQLYTVVDTAVVGKVLGVNALAALGTVEWLNWLALGMIQGFTQGFCILMAQRFGAQDYKGLRRVVTNSLFLSALCAVILTVCCEGLIGTATELLRVPGEIRPMAVAYLRIMFGGIPIVMAYNLAASVLRALGDGKTPLLAMVVAAFTNIGLDFLFVMGFGWGVEGAAIATLIAQCLSAVYCFLHLKKIQILKLAREDWMMERPLCLHLMGLGLPMAFQNSVIAVGGMIVQMIVNGFGVAFIAGLTATNRLYGLLEVAATSYGYAMVTYTGQNLGAGKLSRISRGLRAALVISTITSLLIALVMLVFGRFILSCFISMDAAESAAALDIGYRYLAIMSVFLPILYVLHVTRSCIQGLGNTLLPMISGIAEFVMRTAAAFLLPAMFGENGILFAEILAWAGADLILIPSYFYMIRKVRRTYSCSDCGEKSGKITI